MAEWDKPDVWEEHGFFILMIIAECLWIVLDAMLRPEHYPW